MNALPAAKTPVLMVINGNIRDDRAQIPSFVQSQAEALEQAGWRIFRSVMDDRTSIGGIWRNAQRLQREVADLRPTLVHAQYGTVTAVVAALCKGQRRFLISFCGDDLLGTPCPGWRWRLRERCSRQLSLWAARRADALIVKSDNLLQALPNGLRAKAVIVPNGVNTDWFRPIDRQACRARLGWPQQANIVLFNASQADNQPVKNPALAQAAMARLQQSLPESMLQMMSGVPHETVRLMLNAADCLLVTSLHEGSPNIVKEAMACNLPVVAVACGDVAERLAHTTPSRVCSYDADALAAALHDIIGTGQRSNGREQIIAQGLSAAAVAERVGALYRQIVAPLT